MLSLHEADSLGTCVFTHHPPLTRGTPTPSWRLPHIKSWLTKPSPQKSFIIHNYYDNLNWYSIENASEIWGRKDFCYDSDFTLIPDNASIRHRPPRKKKEKSYKSNYISEFHFPSIKWGKCYLLYRLCAWRLVKRQWSLLALKSDSMGLCPVIPLFSCVTICKYLASLSFHTPLPELSNKMIRKSAAY